MFNLHYLYRCEKFTIADTETTVSFLHENHFLFFKITVQHDSRFFYKLQTANKGMFIIQVWSQ